MKTISLYYRKAGCPRYRETMKYGVLPQVAFIDDDLFAVLNEERWFMHSRGYAYRYVNDGSQRHVMMQDEVMRLRCIAGNDGDTVDHKNRLKLDNQSGNLRWATRSLQGFNQDDNGKSLPRGVRQRGTRFEARCGKTSLGTFSTASQASVAYQRALAGATQGAES